MEWVRRNQVVIPWALLGADLGLRLGARLYQSYNGYYQDHGNVDSPAQSLIPKLHEEQAAGLPYPPDAYPGARDVTSPYGSLRVYEWGPEDGRKVLFVHGITNPCVALGGVAHGLVERGCRVILFGMNLSTRGFTVSFWESSSLLIPYICQTSPGAAIPQLRYKHPNQHASSRPASS